MSELDVSSLFQNLEPDGFVDAIAATKDSLEILVTYEQVKLNRAVAGDVRSRA